MSVPTCPNQGFRVRGVAKIKRCVFTNFMRKSSEKEWSNGQESHENVMQKLLCSSASNPRRKCRDNGFPRGSDRTSHFQKKMGKSCPATRHPPGSSWGVPEESLGMSWASLGLSWRDSKTLSGALFGNTGAPGALAAGHRQQLPALTLQWRIICNMRDGS